jgi:hypothetical protein
VISYLINMAKQRLIENVLVPSSKIIKLDVPLTEAAVDGTTYKALAVYRFPFTRPGQKNSNGRIYLHKLWDRIFQLFRTKSTVSLCNHPEDDGDPARIWAVLRNPGYNEDGTLGMVDCYILDNELGRTANGVLLAGGDLGLSSSGFGDFEADGITVDSDTFELERFFDWVLNPSYAVFGTLDDKKESVVSPDDTKLLEEGKRMKTLTLREKRELEASLKKIYEDIKNISDLTERLSRAREALTFYESGDAGEVESYKKEFEDLAAEAEKEFESKLKSAEEAEDFKKESEETQKLANEKTKEAEDLKKENEELKKENESLKGQIKEFCDIKNETHELLSGMARDAKRKIKWEEYDKLRNYAIRATKLLCKSKEDRNSLQIKVQELERRLEAERNARMTEYQKEMSEKSRIAEVRRQTSEAAAVRNKRLAEAKEKAFIESVNPEVMEYWQDLLRVDEALATEYRVEILSRKTETEAQLFALKARQGKVQRERQEKLPEGFIGRDLSQPLPVKYRDTMPDVPMILPKGYV